ncbi:MAG: patatin-like phospholipase family protein [Ignavibacterium album]|uniref:patatin-like phospholipase family protein n=1 Tax=Ignavibacterium album TaxID=591197 RepID=UPI0026E97DC1|nr:patatin-like phospholipase family protein [Ignavibacterium album]MCX8106633.1 patatin-like phospholipase family protein [Ignavibacterium album]
MLKSFKIILMCLCILSISTFPQIRYQFSIPSKEKPLPFGLKTRVSSNKPVVGFALSGGGARGISQVGVLKAFEQYQIYPDIIVGTSMGSIVGGLYSAGYSVDELDTIARKTDWNDLLTFNRQSNRKDFFVDQKVTEDRAVLTLRLDGLNPVLPTSFNDGQKLSNYLNILTFEAPIHSPASFDLFRYKFRAVCTNLIDGTPVVLESGSLSKALRASSSVTFFLAPVKHDSLTLVDGGLVANVPVEISKQAGADFVVAVDVTSPLWSERELNYPWIIADQIVSIPMRLVNRQQLDKADLIISPQLNDFTSADFGKVDSLILLGYENSLEYAKHLRVVLDSIYSKNISDKEIYFNDVLITDSLQEFELKILGESKFQTISNIDIQKKLEQLFETGYYKNLSAELINDSSGNQLKIQRLYNPEVKDVVLIGLSLISSEGIDEIFSDIKRNPYSSVKLYEALTKLMKLYRKGGYSLAEIQEINFDEDTGTLKIFIDEGIISKIIVQGNDRTNEKVITRELPFSEGDFFKIVDVENGLKNLRSTGLFESVDVSVYDEKGQNVLVIKVDEKQTGLLRVGYRLDNEYRFQLGLDIREENLFGTGTELGFVFFGGIRSRSYIIEQKANRIFDTYFTYKINAFYKLKDILVYKDKPTESEKRFSRISEGEYRQINYGVSLGVGTQVGRFGNLIFEGKYQTDKIKNIQLSPVDPYEFKTVSFKISSTIDTQDKYPYPEKGIYFNGFYETAQTFLGGNLSYTSFGFEYRNYFSSNSDHVISPKFILGFADKTTPLSQQFSIGGQESFFGMHEYEFRGRQIFLASLMYRYKIPFKIFFDTYFKLRYDLGNTWAEQEQIRFKDLRHGIGAALSFATPIGPAEFAVGRSFLFRKDLPENPISWGDVLFYFSIGYYY